MIYEIADIEIQPENARPFIDAVTQAAPLFKAAKGCRSFRLQQGIENPGHFTLVVGWDSVDDHMVDFRHSDGFQHWRNLVSDFFIAPPKVRHIETVIDGF